MEERECAKSWATIGEEGPLNMLPQKPTVGGQIRAGAVLPLCSTASTAAVDALCCTPAVVPPVRDLLLAIGWLKHMGAAVPPTLAVVPPLRVFAPLRLDFQGSYLRVLLPQ